MSTIVLIFRIMSAFAGEYSAQNRDLVTRNTDTVYILSFSIIMLNTSLHNKNVKVSVLSTIVLL